MPPISTSNIPYCNCEVTIRYVACNFDLTKGPLRPLVKSTKGRQFSFQTSRIGLDADEAETKIFCCAASLWPAPTWTVNNGDVAGQGQGLCVMWKQNNDNETHFATVIWSSRTLQGTYMQINHLSRKQKEIVHLSRSKTRNKMFISKYSCKDGPVVQIGHC